MTDVRALIDAEIATLVRLVDAPDSSAVGFGTDLDCVTDCTNNFDEIDPFSALGIAQAAMRALNTPRGSCPDEPNYGIYLPGYVNQGVTQAELRDLSGAIVGELRKDDRISDLSVQLSYDATLSPALSGSLQITPADPTIDTFTATFSVTDASVLLETID